MERYTIKNFNEDFRDDDDALNFVASMVYVTWPDVHCRKCDEITHHYRIKGRKVFSCQKCGTQVSPLAGTIFEKSSTGMKSWMYAIYLVSQTRGGISAKQLERELGVTYKTAWRMFKQIRSLMSDDDGPLQGIVEVDETFVGGKPRDVAEKDEYGRTKRGPRPGFHDPVGVLLAWSDLPQTQRSGCFSSRFLQSAKARPLPSAPIREV